MHSIGPVGRSVADGGGAAVAEPLEQEAASPSPLQMPGPYVQRWPLRSPTVSELPLPCACQLAPCRAGADFSPSAFASAFTRSAGAALSAYRYTLPCEGPPFGSAPTSTTGPAALIGAAATARSPPPASLSAGGSPDDPLPRTAATTPTTT